MIYRADQNIKKKLFTLFENMHDTMIRSCLQGYMGIAWVDNLDEPKAAQIIVGDFVFYAGDPNIENAKELILNVPSNSLIIVNTKEWQQKIETIHQMNVEKIQRYAFKQDPKYLDSIYIQSFLSTLPVGYELRKMEGEILRAPSLHQLSKDFTSQFDSLEDFEKRGLGYCILYKNQVVCGASSYSIYHNGIEIQVDTHKMHRRKGLAIIAVSALILECLKKGIYPNYDAANLASVAVAQKIGYQLEKPYDTYYFK